MLIVMFWMTRTMSKLSLIKIRINDLLSSDIPI